MMLFIIRVKIKMLTPKDVLYIEDLLDQTLVLNKRLSQDTTNIECKDVKECFQKVNKDLKEQYAFLLHLLESEAN
ncbi:MAG: oxidoreductase [Longicatena sp.]